MAINSNSSDMVLQKDKIVISHQMVAVAGKVNVYQVIMKEKQLYKKEEFMGII